MLDSDVATRNIDGDHTYKNQDSMELIEKLLNFSADDDSPHVPPKEKEISHLVGCNHG